MACLRIIVTTSTSGKPFNLNSPCIFKASITVFILGQGHTMRTLLVRKRQRHSVAEEWIKCLTCREVSDRISVWLPFLSVRTPQSVLSYEVKDLFFDQLRAVTARIPGSEFLIPCGYWNGHIGRAGTGYREVHSAMGYGRPEPDVEGERTLEYALAFNPLLGNTFQETWVIFHVQVGKLSHADKLHPFSRTMRKLVTEVKVIPGEEVTLQLQKSGNPPTPVHYVIY